MSGITGTKYSGSYDTIRDGIRDETTDGSKYVRGTKDGKVGLHEGGHSWSSGSGERRGLERMQGGENVFRALCQKLGGDEWGETIAERIFSNIGGERNRHLKEEFRVSDFQRIDQELLTLNWERHVDIPQDLLGPHTRSIRHDTEIPDPNGATGDHNAFTIETTYTYEEYKGVSDDLDRQMKAAVKQRLDKESNEGRIVLGEDRMKQIIQEEFDKLR